MSASLVGSEMCIRDRCACVPARLQRRGSWPWTTPCVARVAFALPLGCLRAGGPLPPCARGGTRRRWQSP
eukprot:2001022-Alexandrium_andersonii.AAC.1